MTNGEVETGLKKAEVDTGLKVVEGNIGIDKEMMTERLQLEVEPQWETRPE
jgi:hypothetical protein